MMTYTKETADAIAKIGSCIIAKYASLVRAVERKQKIIDLWKINCGSN